MLLRKEHLFLTGRSEQSKGNYTLRCIRLMRLASGDYFSFGN